MTSEPKEEVFYDKKKSFFDSISCESTEKSKGRSNRPDWKAEKKLNKETFGVARNMRNFFSGSNRGYLFVRYTNREEAKRAVKELNNYEIKPGKSIGVINSVDNRKLWISNLNSDVRS